MVSKSGSRVATNCPMIRAAKEELKMADDLRTLPIDERMQLVEDIWDSIAADQAALPLTDEQRVELDRRLDAYETDNIKGREASDVVTALKKRL